MLPRFFPVAPGILRTCGKGVSEDEKEHRIFARYGRRPGGRRGGGDDGSSEQPEVHAEADGAGRPQAGNSHGPGCGQHCFRDAVIGRGGEFPALASSLAFDGKFSEKPQNGC